jgi:hypothetical protein
MWEEVIVSRLRSGPCPALAAPPIASTAARALTVPVAVRASTPSGASRSARTGVDSNSSTPRARSRSRKPSASRAGCTVAEVG